MFLNLGTFQPLAFLLKMFLHKKNVGERIMDNVRELSIDCSHAITELLPVYNPS